VGYDDIKRFNGRACSGMSIGGRHVWEYPNGLWDERKTAPDRWDFTFSSIKRRTRSAPAGSGVPAGSQYHWYIREVTTAFRRWTRSDSDRMETTGFSRWSFIMAHQRVRKLDQDEYETFMEGVKYKVAHRRPHWRAWSSEYPGNRTEREVLIAILEEQLAKLKEEDYIETGEYSPNHT
jgi:hypothetical protein